MDQMDSKVITPSEPVDEDAFSLIAILIVLTQRKKLVLGMPLAVACIAALISLLMPNVYSSSTTLMPPQQAQSSAGALLSQLGGAAGLAGAVTGLKNPNDLYVAMLRSRTVADKMIAHFDLKRAYDTESQEAARKALAANTAVSSGKDGLITITVESKDQKSVALMARAYVDELVELTKVLAVTEAARRRVFYEHQLETTKDKLAQAEAKLKGRLESGGVSSAESDSRAMVETIARLRAQVSAKEIQLGSMRAFVTADNQQFRSSQEELNSMRAELARLENGRGETKAVDGEMLVKPAGLENVKILRDVKYYQMLYELLAKQYEIARLDESKDSSVIQVLDSAVDPERKAKPMRAVIVLIAGGLSFFVACAIALLSELNAKMLREPKQAALWARLTANLRMR
jgi:uncharacterized protein involved in exopolysaccharide biosynthesis